MGQQQPPLGLFSAQGLIAPKVEPDQTEGEVGIGSGLIHHCKLSILILVIILATVIIMIYCFTLG